MNKEILAGDLDLAIKELGVIATKTYEGDTWHSDKTQVWEMSKEEFEKLANVEDEAWKERWGWWRSAEGSNEKGEISTFKIYNKDILAWESEDRTKGFIDDEKDYGDLLYYLSDEIGASQPKNICALAIDLAKMNNITMGELFTKYQG